MGSVSGDRWSLEARVAWDRLIELDQERQGDGRTAREPVCPTDHGAGCYFSSNTTECQCPPGAPHKQGRRDAETKTSEAI